jgi:hypothetical protein
VTPNQREIVVDLNFDGTTRVEAFGYEGKTCDEATEFLHEVLEPGEKRYKSEALKVGVARQTKTNKQTT